MHNEVDGQLIFISAITTALGYEIGFEAIAHLYIVGFSSFSVVAALVAVTVGLLGWGVWFLRNSNNRLMQWTLLGTGMLGLLSGIWRGMSG